MGQSLLNALETVGVILALIGLLFAMRQIRDERKAIRQTAELLCRSTKLIYEATKVFGQSEVLVSATDKKRIVDLWEGLLECGETMYQDDQAWTSLIDDLKEGTHD